MSLSALRAKLANELHKAGPTAGALVVDATSGRILFSRRPDAFQVPASVEKLYTTSTALRRWGPTYRLRTAAYSAGKLDPATGTLTGNLYLKGFGDPTYGSSDFDRRAYGTGATVKALADLVARRVTAVEGSLFGDETWFDRLRGVSYSSFRLNSDIGGSLSALAFNRGLANEAGSAFALRPADFSADRLTAALASAGVHVSRRSDEAKMPAGARLIAQVNSPILAKIAQLTNQPSDNWFAEMLLKGLGAAFGGGGSTARGVRVVNASLGAWGIRPHIQDGSGLSRANRTTPRQLVALLRRMRTDPAGTAFEQSLSVAGRSGTLASRMRGTAAAGRCHAKTGTLNGISALAGYCDTRGGASVAFAYLMNGVNVNAARAVQNRMTAAVAALRLAGQTPAPQPTPPGSGGGTSPPG